MPTNDTITKVTPNRLDLLFKDKKIEIVILILYKIKKLVLFCRTDSRRSATHFLMSAKQCTINKFREVASWFRVQVGNISRLRHSVVPFFRDVEQQFEKFKQQVEDEVASLTDAAEAIRQASQRSSEESVEDDGD